MSEPLTEEEELVLDLLEEYLRKKNFIINEIVPFLISRISNLSININQRKINDILISLIKKNVIIEGSKLIKRDILANSNRRIIYNFIKNNPGSYFKKLIKVLNMSLFTISWHLNILCKFKFIKKEKFDNYIAYFDINVNQKDYKLLHIISRNKCKKIIEHLKSNNIGHTKTQISKDIKMHYNTLKNYIIILEQFELIQKKKIANKTLWFLNLENTNDIRNISKNLENRKKSLIENI